MTLFRGTVLDTPEDPFAGGALRAEEDAGLVERDGTIVARGPYERVRTAYPDDDVVDLRGGLVLPGLVDTHVHFPQVRVIGALGMPLLEWLESCALPEEARLADVAYARAVARDLVRGLVRAGTTTALVFGSHFAGAVDALFAEADRVGLRVTSGLVVSDRGLREDLHTTPERAHEEGLALAGRWHGVRRNRYAVTPRFSLSCTDELLASCAALKQEVPETWFTSHLNENVVEIDTVRTLFDDAEHYLHTYAQHGLVGRRSVLAHNVHATHDELVELAAAGASVAHCPTSNSALGSGLFPLRQHLEHGVRVALGSDVGAGTGFSLLKEGLQAYFMQQLLGERGEPLAAPHLLHLTTTAGAHALGLGDTVGQLSVGHELDLVWLRPEPGSTLDVVLTHATSAEDALGRAFALGTSSDVAGTWVAGRRVVPSAL
ncbi:guanine deaminase [Ornithinimicrobium avium]|uniref:Guanine deaminase n=1 Tax=Ornithinimicrobium avium TaxID=2283195 RepID=A0A345NRV3_9MICO|nr:guanine deaminase [Ornithinimicrobium avium]AXH97761.1 guanine deaminase [Ornithinimicrobium avium]